MFYTAAAVFIVIWLLGLISDILMGGFIHLFLVAAAIMILWQATHRKREAKRGKKMRGTI